MTTWDKCTVGVILALLLSFAVQSRGTVIEGAYEGCTWEWRPWAINASQWLEPDDLYIVSHGYYSRIYPLCNRPDISPEQVGQHKFAFFAVCDGMCGVGPGTFSSRAMESVGYCGMSEPGCGPCWSHAVSFQDYLFRRHASGSPWSVAYDQAISAFPECAACVRYFNRAADIVGRVLAPNLLR